MLSGPYWRRMTISVFRAINRDSIKKKKNDMLYFTGISLFLEKNI